uniref:Uncharacterized protein n=1 Tax=Arundo donax TaxID=35708 RepID=A0A0A9AIY7_ARUDO
MRRQLRPWVKGGFENCSTLTQPRWWIHVFVEGPITGHSILSS